jgi:hypothetical protein
MNDDTTQYPQELQQRLDEFEREYWDKMAAFEAQLKRGELTYEGYIQLGQKETEAFFIAKIRAMEDYYGAIRSFDKAEGEIYKVGDVIYLDSEGKARVMKPDTDLSKRLPYGVAIESGNIVTVLTKGYTHHPRLMINGQMVDIESIDFNTGVIKLKQPLVPGQSDWGGVIIPDEGSE